MSALQLASSIAWRDKEELTSQTLTSENLAIFLQDPIFVEYFNAFLLLPIFSCRVFYNRHNGLFEQVQCDSYHSNDIVEGTNTFYRTLSEETLYLTDNNIEMSLEPHHIWKWVTQYRLPLFIKSDLYSEYKLHQLLMTECSSFLNKYIKQEKEKLVIEELKWEQSFPEKRVRSGRPRSTRRRSASFNVTMTTPPLSRPKSTTKTRNTSDLPLLSPSPSCHSNISSPSIPRSASRRRSATFSDSKMATKLSKMERELNMLTSKSGMNWFRKFLSGKAGERNWLYWLDVEQLRTCDKPDDQQRLLKEIKDCYFKSSSSSLGLPIDFCSQYNLRDNSTVSIDTLTKIQDVMLDGLRKYWYPRFLLHSLQKDTTLTHSIPSLPSHKSPSLSHQYKDVDYVNNTPHPSKASTPTIRRVSSTRIGLKPNPPSHSRAQSTPLLLHSEGGLQPLKAKPPSKGIPLSDVASTTRLLWSRDSVRERVDSSNLFSKLAKYNTYPVMPSRRTSVMSTRDVSQPLSPIDVHNDSDLQILSVSGTPTDIREYHSNRNGEYRLLLKCLAIEKRKSGGYFQQHLETLEDKSCIQCLLFWRDVQEYKSMFFGSTFNPTTVEMKAKFLYGHYIVDGSSHTIQCPHSIQCSIHERLWPAYEDIFDDVEEYVLSILFEVWIELCKMDEKLFEKHCYFVSDDVIKDDVIMPSLIDHDLDKLSEECGSTYSDTESSDSSLTRSPSPLSLIIPSQDVRQLQNQSDHPSLTEIEDKIETSVENKEMSFNDIMNNPKELEHFKIFLNNNHAAIDLICWMEIESFRSIPPSDKVLRNIKSKQIRSKYFTKQYFFGSQSPASKEEQRQVVNIGGGHKLASCPKSSVFIEAQKHIRSRLEKKWVPIYVKTEEFLERHNGGRSGQEQREVDNENGGLSLAQYIESHETILLKRTLQDKTKCLLFKHFISIQAPEGTAPANNVDFWLEVQRFKEMFHTQMNPDILKVKMKAIIFCYIQSPCSPRVQIKIPPAMAEELVKKKFGPYVFREAQTAVFNYLQSSWQEYQTFCTDNAHQPLNIALRTLERQIKEQRRKAEDAVKLEKLEEERKRSSVLYFETEEERKARFMKEKELKEFGEVAVSFRLSSSRPDYTYCGQMGSLHYQLHPEQQEHISGENIPQEVQPTSHRDHTSNLKTRNYHEQRYKSKQNGKTGFQESTSVHVRFQSPVSTPDTHAFPVKLVCKTGSTRLRTKSLTGSTCLKPNLRRTFSLSNERAPSKQLNILPKIVSVKS